MACADVASICFAPAGSIIAIKAINRVNFFIFLLECLMLLSGPFFYYWFYVLIQAAALCAQVLMLRPFSYGAKIILYF